MKKIIFTTLSAFLLANFSYASEKWTQEEISNELVNRGRLGDLDLVGDLFLNMNNGSEIAKILGIIDDNGNIKLENNVIEINNNQPSPNQFHDDLSYARQLQQEENRNDKQLNNNNDNESLLLALQLQEEENRNDNHINNNDNESLLLALHLQEEENNFNQNNQFWQSDRLMAELLQQEENPHVNSNNRFIDHSLIPSVKVTQELWNSLEEARSKFKEFDNIDVHEFNRKFVQVYKSKLIELAKILDLDEKTSPSDVVKSLEQYAQGSFHSGVKQMNTHNASQIDPETGLRIDHALSWVFNLCQKINNLHHVNFNAYPYLVESIKENIDTNGGCHPGYTGRLFRDFVFLAHIYLSNVIRDHN